MASSLVLFLVTWLSVGVSSFQDPQGWTTRSLTSSYDCTSADLNATVRIANEEEQTYSGDGKYGECMELDAYGILVHVTAAIRGAGPRHETSADHTGCNLPFRSSINDGQLPNQPWIALIKRGGCNFENKVENAYLSKAAAVIVYDDKTSASLQKMKLSAPERNMSAVFTTRHYGELLADLIDQGTPVYMELSVGNPCGYPYNINRTSVLFVSISFIILMVISLAWLVFYYVQRFRYTHAKDKLSKRLGNAAKKALSRIPVKSVKTENKDAQGEGECCAVCIEPFKLSEVLRILPCKHEFHKSCIDPWLLEHRTCPMCKMDILKHYGFVFTGSQESILHLDVDETAVPHAVESAIPTPITPEPSVNTSLHHSDSSRTDPEVDLPRSSVKLVVQNEESHSGSTKPDSEAKMTNDK